jgi:FtsP/CotA-like multicopper oxidase with cupredoxin domain
VIPPKVSEEFVCQMEEVLQLYTMPKQEYYPLICFDETSKQLVKETRAPIPTEFGHPERYDFEYERNGTANLFICFASLKAWLQVTVTDTRTAINYAH